MSANEASARVLAHVDEDRLLALECALIRIPSTTFEEGEIADYLATYMADLGLEVEMMQVANPKATGSFTRQPVGPPGGHRRRAEPDAERPHGSGHRDVRLVGRSPTAPSSRTAGSGVWARMMTRVASRRW